MKSVSNVARKGALQNRRAIANVARIDMMGQSRNAQCRANSLQPMSEGDSRNIIRAKAADSA